MTVAGSCGVPLITAIEIPSHEYKCIIAKPIIDFFISLPAPREAQARRRAYALLLFVKIKKKIFLVISLRPIISASTGRTDLLVVCRIGIELLP